MTSFCRFTFFAVLFIISRFADGQQKSFAETQFDLSPDLPAEELPPPAVAANQDQSPSTVIVPQTPPPPPPTQPPPPPPPSPPPTVQTSPPTLVSLLPSTQALLPSTQLSSAFTGENAAATTTANPKTPLPNLPTLVELPRFVQNGNVQPITVPTSLIEPGGANQTTIISIPTVGAQQNLIPLASSPPAIKAPLAKLPPLRQISTGEQQVWFRDDFDIKDCPRNAEAIGKYFRKKFPKNLLRHQKETVLAELLAIRLRECLKKQREDHWIRLDKQLEKERIEGDSNESEREECRAALVQEQIACMNLQSFSCQFIQPTFLFRLIPARLIVQEARLAEDGAERCRKFSLISGNRKLSAGGNS